MSAELHQILETVHDEATFLQFVAALREDRERKSAHKRKSPLLRLAAALMVGKTTP